MENLDGRHGDLERGVRGSPDVEISGFSRLEFGIPRLRSHSELERPAWRIGTAGMENWIFAGWGHYKQQNFNIRGVILDWVHKGPCLQEGTGCG